MTQTRVRISHGIRVIGVRVIEILRYMGMYESDSIDPDQTPHFALFVASDLVYTVCLCLS